MRHIPVMDYSSFDRPEIAQNLFHPRPEGTSSQEVSKTDVLIPVEENVAVGASFHLADKSDPTILYFHGNGEIVADYDELAPIFTSMGINFLAADYRGYGRSSGWPTVSAMMNDCHVIFDYVRTWLAEHDHTGPLIVMGRSLGSASALELAYHYKDTLDGLIIESGFAYFLPLLELIGIRVRQLGLSEEEGCRNVNKIGTFDKPTLIIHAEYDHIIPFSDGSALYDASAATDKILIKIEGADHNDILFRGFRLYMQGIHDLVQKLKG
jgi:alpha-beta hydrolase superfamily lysophospholipase